jgi:selenocysteine lyase/cysteine desulfurase
MTLDEILADETLRRREFPVAQYRTFLAHAGVCPLPQRVIAALQHYATYAGTGDQESGVLEKLLTDGRQLAAQLIHAQPDEIAFVGPTSLALSFAASGLTFRRGDNILIYHDDYPSNVYPWMALAEKGIQVRLMNIRHLGVIRPRDVIGQVDEQTRLVALASCHFVSGWRIDRAELRKRKILFCLDAIQTLGAFPTTVENVDILAADSHKWLLGPCGAGILYVRKEVQPFIQPPVFGSNNVRSPNYIAQDGITFRSGAKRYEPGSYNLLSIVGLNASIELALEIGVERIARELIRKRARLVHALQAKGYTVLNAEAAAENCGGITTFFKPDADLAVVQAKLAAANVVASLRADRQGQQYIRLSPHYYNTDAELDQALALL